MKVPKRIHSRRASFRGLGVKQIKYIFDTNNFYMPSQEMFFNAPPHIFEKARSLRARMTFPEKLIWEYLKKNQLGVKFRRQHPIEFFIADFYCHSIKLVIEIDGEIHNQIENAEYDIGRTFEIEKYGITVIRFTNEEILKDIENSIKKINSTIKGLNTNDTTS